MTLPGHTPGVAEKAWLCPQKGSGGGGGVSLSPSWKGAGVPQGQVFGIPSRRTKLTCVSFLLQSSEICPTHPENRKAKEKKNVISKILRKHVSIYAE